MKTLKDRISESITNESSGSNSYSKREVLMFLNELIDAIENSESDKISLNYKQDRSIKPLRGCTPDNFDVRENVGFTYVELFDKVPLQ